jgi:hypothetical protein
MDAQAAVAKEEKVNLPMKTAGFFGPSRTSHISLRSRAHLEELLNAAARENQPGLALRGKGLASFPQLPATGVLDRLLGDVPPISQNQEE